MTIKTLHEITEILTSVTYISYLILVWFIDNKYINVSITKKSNLTVAQSCNGQSKIETLFGGYWSFFLSLKLIPIDRLTNNTVERLKVCLIEQLFYDMIYESNPQNSGFNYLPFDSDERLITGRQIYCINHDILFSLNNGSIVDV